MLSIGNKKYRNLQEQVGFNTEQIEKIFDVLDGLAVTDNVVAIADLSDNLNENQLEIVQKSVAFLVYGGQLYIKKSEDTSKAYFDIVFTISSSGGVISFNSKEIEVDLATGALSQTISTNSTYSSSQIDTKVGAKADTTYVDTQLALKANLAGANFTGAITAPSIIENMIGYSYEAGLPSSYFDYNNVYVGASKTGNKLTLVIFGSIKKTQEILSGSLGFGKFTIPSEVANKIAQYQLGSLNNVVDNQKIEFANTHDTYIECPVDLIKNSNEFELRIYGLSTFILGTTYLFRYEATFLLSDNLAS